jgi:hypothetical protein
MWAKASAVIVSLAGYTYVAAGSEAIAAAVLLEHDVPPANRPVTYASYRSPLRLCGRTCYAACCRRSVWPFGSVQVNSRFARSPAPRQYPLTHVSVGLSVMPTRAASARASSLWCCPAGSLLV